MAAVTPDTITQTNLGSMTAYVYDLPATTDSTNTVDTGLSDIRFAFISQADAAGTQASQGAGVSFSGSTFTVCLGEDNSAATVLVLAGGA